MRIKAASLLLISAVIGCNETQNSIPKPLPTSWNESNLERVEKPTIKERRHLVEMPLGFTVNQIDTYTESGNIARTNYIGGPNLTPFKIIDYDYDLDGNEISRVEYATNDEYYMAIEHEYDDQHRVVKTTVADDQFDTNIPYQQISYKKTENLVIRTTISFNETGEKVETSSTESEFDDKGRLIKRKTTILKSNQTSPDFNYSLYFYGNREVSPATSQQYVTEDMVSSIFLKHDTAGNLIEEWDFIDGVVRSHVRFIYNEFGDRIERQSLSPYNGNVFLSTYYELNEFGDPIERRSYNYARNELSNTLKYELDYY